MLYNYLPNALQYLLATYIFTPQVTTPGPLRFGLRHEFGLTNSSRPVFSNIHAASQLTYDAYEITTQRTPTYRPRNQDAFFRSRHFSSEARRELGWEETELEGPDVNDRETLLMLAKMTANAYSRPGQKDWYDLGPDWNNSYPFGWEPDSDGFRGHIFATEDNSTVIISVKGTSAGWVVGGGGPTTRKDKLNDNLLFSCCCARVGPTWSPVCDCYRGNYKCDQNCLEKSLVDDSLFYPVGTNLYNNVTYLYPDANIWVIGHSLGGSLASLLGVTFGVPVVAFEAVGEKLAAQRLHLALPPSLQHITHVYNTGDPIAMGTCTGVASTCAIGGFALETGCHLGKVIRYDTVTHLKWSVHIGNHGIAVVIDHLLSKEWAHDNVEGGENRTVPALTEEEGCVDCYNWEYGDFEKSLDGPSCGLRD
ncbi:hypothetical protein QCA50_006332 [Cerrena zonata]|uniref:triacylglycerol lipase n=1 Tax=Cerrena zonata TaxID=2478898 RepID=A0AAW0GHF1_9APHY